MQNNIEAARILVGKGHTDAKVRPSHSGIDKVSIDTRFSLTDGVRGHR